MVDRAIVFFFEAKALGPVDSWKLLQLENDGRWIRVFLLIMGGCRFFLLGKFNTTPLHEK